MSEIRFHDVKPDGNCFYSCIHQCLISFTGNQIPNAIRKYTPNQIRHNDDIWNRILNLLEILISILDSDLIENFPLIMNLEKLDRNLIADRVSETDIWVSEIEHGIVKDFLQLKDINLITVDCDEIDVYQNSDSLEKQILKALSTTMKENSRCIILIRSGNRHYSYLSLYYDPVPYVSDIKNYLNEIYGD